MSKSIIIFLLLCSAQLFAQVPGFQGKRLSVEGSCMFNAALSNYNENLNKGFRALNKRLQAGLEYIIGRNVSVGANYGILTSGMEYKYYDYNNSYNYYSRDKYRLSCNIAGLYLKIFKFRKKGSIAPYGFYGKIGLLGLMANGNFIERNNPLNTDPPERLRPVNLVFFNYGFGKQFIIKGRFIARMGADFGFNFSLLSSWGVSGLSATAQRRISNAMLVNLEAGIGVLIF
jgi:hypothetical protein